MMGISVSASARAYAPGLTSASRFCRETMFRPLKDAVVSERRVMAK